MCTPSARHTARTQAYRSRSRSMHTTDRPTDHLRRARVADRPQRQRWPPATHVCLASVASVVQSGGSLTIGRPNPCRVGTIEMCGRFTQKMSWCEVHTPYRMPDRATPLNLQPRYNGCSSQSFATCGLDSSGGGAIAKLRCEVSPAWARDAKTGSRLINARAERCTRSQRSARCSGADGVPSQPTGGWSGGRRTEEKIQRYNNERDTNGSKCNHCGTIGSGYRHSNTRGRSSGRGRTASRGKRGSQDRRLRPLGMRGRPTDHNRIRGDGAHEQARHNRISVGNLQNGGDRRKPRCDMSNSEVHGSSKGNGRERGSPQRDYPLPERKE